MTEPDREQLARDYDRITAAGYRERWSADNAGNQQIVAERAAVLGGLIRANAFDRGLRVLDLGCGNLSMLPAELDVQLLVGADLLLERLVTLRQRGDRTPVVNADGSRLPFTDGTFDAVIMSTMLTSVLDDVVRRRVAGEVERVLRPGGHLLWYDMRLPNPRNPATKSIGRRQLRALFPSLAGEIVSLTVVPQLARRLGGTAGRVYPLVARVPFLRSHLAACLRKPV